MDFPKGVCGVPNGCNSALRRSKLNLNGAFPSRTAGRTVLQRQPFAAFGPVPMPSGLGGTPFGGGRLPLPTGTDTLRLLPDSGPSDLSLMKSGRGNGPEDATATGSETIRATGAKSRPELRGTMRLNHKNW